MQTRVARRGVGMDSGVNGRQGEGNPYGPPLTWPEYYADPITSRPATRRLQVDLLSIMPKSRPRQQRNETLPWVGRRLSTSDYD